MEVVCLVVCNRLFCTHVLWSDASRATFYVIISQFGTAYWFAFLFLLAPIIGKFESPKNLPLSIHKSLK